MKNSESNISTQDKLNAVLKEYETLRNEIIKCSDRQLQLFYIMVPVLSAVYGYIVAQHVPDILYIAPLLVSPFIFRYIWEQRNLEVQGKYMKEEIEEKRIPDILGYRCAESNNNYDRYWIGWQHYWDDIGFERMKRFGFYSKHSALLGIFLISFLPSMIYSILSIISSYIDITIGSHIPAPVHILAFILYSLLFGKMLKDLRYSRKG